MTIDIIGRGTTVRDSFKERVEKKLSKFDRFFDENTKAEVKVFHESGNETVEITIHSGGMVFRSTATTEERMESLEIAVDKLFKQITRNKSKLQTKLRKTAFEVPVEMAVLPDDYDGEEDEDEDFEIIKSKQFFLKPMFPEEAVLQMDLIGHDFYVFRNAESEEVNVVYKRKQGKYGLIEPTDK